MSKDQEIAINEAVRKLQLALLDGITDQKQLFAAGSLMSRSDYEDVVTERTIAKLCGYPLCGSSLPSEPSRRGRYRISLKEHKVYDMQEACKFCSSDCLISSRAFSGTLAEARCSVFESVKLNEILGLFEDSEALESVDVKEDLGLSKLTIHENAELKVGDMSLEDWMGPSNAIEGYVPLNKSNNKSRNRKQDSGATQNKQSKDEVSLFSEMDFTSTVITSDEYSVSKLPPQTDKASSAGKSEELKGKRVIKDPSQSSVSPKKKDSSYSGKSNKPKTNKNIGFSEMDFVSEIITSNEYSVSKPLPHSIEVPLDSQAREAKGQKYLETMEQQVSLTGSSSAFREKGLSEKPKESERKFKFVENVPDSCQDGAIIRTGESSAQNISSSSETSLKPSLKPSGSKKLNRSVTWADENAASDGHGNLCEFRDIEGRNEGVDAFSCTDRDDDDDKVSRLASAEALARALSQAAEAVASGDSDASDAISKAGIVLLPNPPQVDGEIYKVDDSEEEETPESEPTLLKWPNKPGILDSDLFDPDQSWFDGPPEAFSLTLSAFAMMWNAIFGWVSSSSLAYIYGKEENEHEEFVCVNGREYPRKIILSDGRSSEIKETIAGCLARSLPGLTTDLRLPIPISELEKGLGSLLETMTFTEAIPALRMKQWQVIVLLFMDALSVSRLPLLTHYISNTSKVLEGAGIGTEEYEVMKDLLMPLGRVPQFSSRSGA
ncbi:PREDICTED: putative RNA polymerase II subunit B1 CTD phosphatase RPAP2 homolog [Tarenaya hassleriana]|uniref:putative RNA polymerase II subunit B1 CTD phosphatase RPAP2 homolog n=1 Tax=Tarenaya hassleriana TaxID=28532 RepID=UPI00053CA1DF|nr:PREDICTED: putative RNA polymerase II subunit B1 CTD phosphatase RPAP2 homolog [Tarenaya hassleriana]